MVETLMLTCQTCKGARIERWHDWESFVAKPCRECNGTGETLATAEEIAMLDESMAVFNAEMDAAEVAATVEEIERDISPVPVAITVDHPGMTASFFDAAIRRAHAVGLTATFSGADTALVTSASNPTVRYLATRTSCSCQGHLGQGRCLHRALVIFLADVVGTQIETAIAA